MLYLKSFLDSQVIECCLEDLVVGCDLIVVSGLPVELLQGDSTFKERVQKLAVDRPVS